MANSRYALYKYVKVAGTWRYCKAACHDNGKIKPDIVFVNVKEGQLEEHPEGRNDVRGDTLRSANQEFAPSLRYPASKFRTPPVLLDAKMAWRCNHD